MGEEIRQEVLPSTTATHSLTHSLTQTELTLGEDDDGAGAQRPVREHAHVGRVQGRDEGSAVHVEQHVAAAAAVASTRLLSFR